jgi:peroxiredoxin-like protein
MDPMHQFRVVAWWSSDRTGIAKSDSAPNAIQFTAPVSFGGVEGRWTPEDMFLGSIASCYTTTFHTLAEYSQLEYADLEVQVEGTIQKDGSGYSFKEIVIRPNLTISSEQDHARATRLLQKAKSLCLVSRALSVVQKFEPKLLVNESRTEVGRSLPMLG